MPSLAPYSPALDYSYAPGVFPSMECLKHRPDAVRRLLLHSSAAGRDGADKLRGLAESGDHAPGVLRLQLRIQPHPVFRMDFLLQHVRSHDFLRLYVKPPVGIVHQHIIPGQEEPVQLPVRILYLEAGRERI